MEVAGLCHRNVVTVRQSEELTAAAELMRAPTSADSSVKPVGVLTDRDIVITVVARQADPRTVRVGDVMTQQPVVVAETDSLEMALEEMRRIGARRLPVVGASGQLVGVLALDDIIDTLAMDLGNVAASIRNAQRMESALRP